MILTCLLVLYTVLGVSHGCKSKPTPPNKPPTITCPSVSDRTADKGKEYTQVSWTPPSAKDPDGKISSVSLKTGKAPGESFGPGQHVITYVATDNGGLTSFCSITFQVRVVRCHWGMHVVDGRPNCDGIIYGSTCKFICNEGYELKGSDTSTCNINKKWVPSPPKCTAKKCPPLKLAPNMLSYACTKGHYTAGGRLYGSICWATCDETNGYAPIRGQWTMCTKDQTWTNIRMACEDTEKPVIHNCPAQTIMATKDPGADSTQVNWNRITVTDNSKDVTLNTGAYKADGGVFSTGFEMVKFTATDGAGNTAEPCFFIVRVQTVSCDPPDFGDQYLDYECNEGYSEGKSCQLNCYRALIVNGTKFITCRKDTTSGREVKGYWDWGQKDTPSKTQPYCPVHNCTALRAPNNGALACDMWLLGQQCQMQCHEDYDIPENKAKPLEVFQCFQNTGRWNQAIVPDCAYREFSESVRMPEYFYFSGSCANAKDEIAANFITALKKKMTCVEEKWCNVQNVNIKCGDEVDDDEFGISDDDDFERRKRSTRSRGRRPSTSRRRGGSRGRGGRRDRRKRQYVVFNIVMKNDKSGGSFKDNIALYNRKLRSQAKTIVKMQFEAAGRTIKADKVRVSVTLPVCAPGLKIGVKHKDSCVPCPRGSYHDTKRDECIACPLGQYQPEEGKVECRKCPSGQTTTTIANTDKQACEVMCRPGEFSSKGVVPCAPCLKGTYQSRENGTTCSRCPVGTTTASTGNKAANDCIPLDMLLHGPLSVGMEGKSPAPICDFTFAVWIKLVETDSHGIKFELYSPITGVGLEVAISENITVHIDRTHSVHLREVVDDKWTHVAVTWTGKKLTIFRNGVAVRSQSLDGAKACPSPTESAMRVVMRDHSYIYLRDLNLLTSAQPTRMKTFAKTCSTNSLDTLFSIEEMATDKRIHEVLPSSCLNPGVCAKRPCGENICIPNPFNYTCACRGGYTGKHCEIAPDLCKDNICRNGAKCLMKGSTYKCDCQPGFRGVLCQDSIVDGGWGKWQEYGACSTSCGNGTRTRQRFCNNPYPARGGKACQGDKSENIPCYPARCPECDVSTLVVGKGVIPSCDKSGESITCSVRCEIGKVFPEQPFNYTCSQGIWTPTRQTVSCTDPVTPISVGISYTVVFDNAVANPDTVTGRLGEVGRGFSCASSGDCSIYVNSSACSPAIDACQKHDGEFYGSLLLQAQVPDGQIDLVRLQSNEKRNAYLSPLFSTWDVFTHSSEESTAAAHRALELSLTNNSIQVYRFDNPQSAVTVPGQFGELLKTWKEIDDANWQVRADNYVDFGVPLGRTIHDPNLLTARQTMVCPVGAVQGGVFCIKCPPGKYYLDGECRRCLKGFYQDEAGMTSCKACPGLQTTDLLGSNSKEQCVGESKSEMKILLGLNKPGFGVFDIKTLNLRTVALEMSRGKVQRLAYTPGDGGNGYVYYSTTAPAVLGRVMLDGSNDDLLMEMDEGTDVTGLDVDVAADLVFYTTFDGTLAAMDVMSGAVHTLLSNLSQPRDLVLDQNMGIYLVEGNSIVYVNYSGGLRNVVTDKDTVWNPVFYQQEHKLYWESYNSLRSAFVNGTSVQTLALRFTPRHGHTDDYYYHVNAEGGLVRVNKNLKARVEVFSFPRSVVRTRTINTTDNTQVHNICSDRGGCQHGCLPLNTTSRTCFCAVDTTLQTDRTTCRPDYSESLTADDHKNWLKPKPAVYSVPPSKTLRLKVKACHSARVALSETNRKKYKVELGQRRGNVTEMSIKKFTKGRVIVLDTELVDHLRCDSFRTFWLVWQNHELSVGIGEIVGQGRKLFARDNLPFDINYVEFGVGFNATANWQF